jgi:type II secretory pathway component GspD/PulD (secretin)
MKFANKVFVTTLALILSGLTAWAQPEPAAAKPNDDSVETFYLKNVVSQSSDGNEILTAIRNIVTPESKVFFVPGQNAILVRTSPDQLLLTQKLIKDLDLPKKTYRLIYTFTEMDGGKSVGTQHFEMIVVSGERTTLKQGSKIPLATGSFDSGKLQTQTQFTYIDVGLNFDAALDESVNGVRLRSKVEQSSVADQVSIAGVQEPIIRQTVLTSTSFLTPGKPLVLGSLDIPGSTRHLDVGVVMEPIR